MYNIYHPFSKLFLKGEEKMNLLAITHAGRVTVTVIVVIAVVLLLLYLALGVVFFLIA